MSSLKVGEPQEFLAADLCSAGFAGETRHRPDEFFIAMRPRGGDGEEPEYFALSLLDAARIRHTIEKFNIKYPGMLPEVE